MRLRLLKSILIVKYRAFFFILSIRNFHIHSAARACEEERSKSLIERIGAKILETNLREHDIFYEKVGKLLKLDENQVMFQTALRMDLIKIEDCSRGLSCREFHRLQDRSCTFLRCLSSLWNCMRR